MSSSPDRRRPLWREPLVHFLLLALAILGVERLLSPPPGPSPVVIDDAFVAGLRAEAQGRGEPAEVDPVARWLQEEALFREALALGLDRGDPIVRRRLVQKMEFLLRSELAPGDPSDAELEATLARSPERFRVPARVAFEHVFYDRGRHDDAEAVARQALAVAGERAPVGGSAFLLGARFGLEPVVAHAARLGEEFASGLESAPLERWSGPLTSPYGAHLVRVTRRQLGGTPPLSEVREAVRAVWAREAEEAALQEAIEALRARLPLDDRRTP